MSTYLVSIYPNMYGEKHSEYQKETLKVVLEFSNRFHQAVQDKKDLKALFHDTLRIMGDIRNRIAMEHGTNYAEKFGKRRDFNEFYATSTVTYLAGPYFEYNKKIHSLIKKHLSGIADTHDKISPKRNYSIEAVILSQNDKKWLFKPTVDEYRKLSALGEIISDETPSGNPLKFERIFENREAMCKIKQKSPEDYKRIKLFIQTSELRSRFNVEISNWILINTRLEIEGKMYALSQYLLEMNLNHNRTKININDDSMVTILHEDPFLIEPILNDIANIFKQAIECDSNDLNTIKNHVALLHFEFAHAMPFKKGSAAISEWLEMSIYLYHGYKLTYNPNKMVNLEALTSPLSEFISNYDSMIVLNRVTATN